MSAPFRLPGAALPARWRVACEADPELMFPASEDCATPTSAAQVAAAKAVCATCPVLAGCREWALGAALPYGVAGGMTADERARVRSAGQLGTPALRPLLLRAVVSAPVAAVLGRHADHDGAREVDELVVARLAAGGRVGAASRWEVALAAVAMVTAGGSPAAAARVVGEHPRQVDRWVARHRAGQPLIRWPGRRSAGSGAVA